MWIATQEQCREIDRATSEEYGIPSRVLMERAGLAVFDAVREILPRGGSISVVCGKGNNGGDGFVVARLANERGYRVECAVAAHREALTPEAEEQMRVARAEGVKLVFHGEDGWDQALACLGCSDVIVDALLGTGASGLVTGPVAEAIAAINASGVPVVSVDIPSGISCDTGEELGASVWAMRTVTFGLPKPFLFQGEGLEQSGYWTVADIGIPQALLNRPTAAKLIDQTWVADLLPERLRGSHKGQNGTVLVVAGSRGMPGAATLAARSALRAGAGLVTVAGIPLVCEAVAANLPEAILVPLPETPEGTIHPDAAKIVLERQGRFQSALFGPGLTHEAPVRRFLSEVWAEWNPPAVIDADALNSVSEGVTLPKGPCVLTPHPGEMSRMLQCSIAEIQADRFHTVQMAVAKFSKTVLLKGPYSIVGEPSSVMEVNSTGNPGMASGGMGDVLSGVIVTLLAQELPAMEAACCGMFWHGLAGDACAANIGTVGYTASEVADALPAARATITGRCERDSSASS